MNNIGRRAVLLCLLLGALVMGGCEGKEKPALPENEAAAIHQEGTEKGLADIDLAHNTFSLEPVGAPDPENGTREVNCIDSSHASREQLDVIQAYLDSLDFETVDLEEWVGGDLARAMEGEYAALDIVTLHYFVRVAPYSRAWPGWRSRPGWAVHRPPASHGAPITGRMNRRPPRCWP